jgi:hypothetical protein
MKTSKSRAAFSRLLNLSLVAGVVAVATSGTLGARSASSEPSRAATSGLSRAIAGETPDAEFKSAFDKLVAKKDKAELAKLVKEHVKDAVDWTVYSCEQISEQSSDELETFMSEMREAWKTAEKTDFAERVYTYFSTVSGVNKKDRAALKKRYDTARDELEKNLQKKDNFVFQNIVDEFEVLGGAFEQVGDMYTSSQAWLACAACYDEPLRGSNADLFKAFSAYVHALDARDRIELKDPAYEEALHRKTALAGKGFDKKKKDVAGPAPQEAPPPQPAQATGGGATIPMTFEVVASLDAYQRPCYAADEIYVIWNPIQLKGKGTSGGLPYIQGSPLLYRIGANDLRFDTDGDGVGDEKVNFTGNIAPIKLTIGKGDEQRPWAFLGVTATDKESYENLQVNLAPNDTQISIYTYAAASIVGTIGTTPVRVIDETTDGIYGSAVELRGATGCSKDNFEPAVDSVVIGNSKRARPWSEYQEIDGKWYKLEVAKTGKEMKATPVNVDTGILKLDYKGPAPTWLVVHGDGEQRNSYFDLVEGGAKGVSVPVGKYSLSYGDVRKGKKKQTQKALILPGKSTPTWTVSKGQTAVVTLGAPYGFDFEFNYAAEKATITGRSVVIVGSQSERYERTWNCVPKPEVEWRAKGSKQSKRAARMTGIVDTDLLYKVGWEAAWSPLDLEFKAAGDKIELQLVDKKHDLFGKIESAWKE